MTNSSGTVLGNNVDGSEGSWLNWQVASQNPGGNYTTLNWQAGWRFSTTSCRGLRLALGVINGTTVYDDHDAGDGVHAYVSGHDHRPQLQTSSGSINVPHNPDGTKTFSASMKMTGFSGLLSQGSSTWTLPPIANVPDAPSAPVISNATPTSVDLSWSPNDDGGLPIFAFEIGYSTDPDDPEDNLINNVTSPYTLTGLDPGVTYYFWVRAENAVGDSDFSERTSTATVAGIRVKVGAVWKLAIPYVRDGGVWKHAHPWVRVMGEWKETV